MPVGRRRTVPGAGWLPLPCLLLTPLAAHPQMTKAFQVGAQIVAGCVVAVDGGGRWGSIDFGTVSGADSGTVEADLLSGAATGLQIECTPNMTASISIDNGDHSAGGVRRMAHAAGDTISYELFADGSTTPWTSQALPLSFSAGQTLRVLPIRGRAQLVPPMRGGVYSDTVRVTLSW